MHAYRGMRSCVTVFKMKRSSVTNCLNQIYMQDAWMRFNIRNCLWLPKHHGGRIRQLLTCWEQMICQSHGFCTRKTCRKITVLSKYGLKSLTWSGINLWLIIHLPIKIKIILIRINSKKYAEMSMLKLKNNGSSAEFNLVQVM